MDRQPAASLTLKHGCVRKTKRPTSPDTPRCTTLHTRAQKGTDQCYPRLPASDPACRTCPMAARAACASAQRMRHPVCSAAPPDAVRSRGASRSDSCRHPTGSTCNAQRVRFGHAARLHGPPALTCATFNTRMQAAQRARQAHSPLHAHPRVQHLGPRMVSGIRDVCCMRRCGIRPQPVR